MASSHQFTRSKWCVLLWTSSVPEAAASACQRREEAAPRVVAGLLPSGIARLLRFGAEGRPAVVEGHAHAFSGGGGGVEDRAAFRGVGRHRLFGDDVAA